MLRSNASRQRSRRDPKSGAAPTTTDWNTLKRRTLASEALDAIVAAAARGLILPGDRIVDSEVARQLGTSRIPVREALRALETQGVVTSEPHRGFRLMSVSREHLHQVLEVRLALESLAARRAIECGRNQGEWPARLEEALDRMAAAARIGDAYRIGQTDTDFHRALCRAGGNEVLVAMWEGLSRQLTIIFGLSALVKSAAEILREHRLVIAAFERGDPDPLDAVLRDHIVTQIEDVDFDRLIAARRAERPQPDSPGAGTVEAAGA